MNRVAALRLLLTGSYGQDLREILIVGVNGTRVPVEASNAVSIFVVPNSWLSLLLSVDVMDSNNSRSKKKPADPTNLHLKGEA